MDQVLLTLGYLSMQHTKLLEDDEDRPRATSIINSIEKRWAAADQEVFIAAVVLNPFFKTIPFANHISLTNAGIHTLLECLWLCFFGGQNAAVAPLELDTQIADYLMGTGVWVDLQTRTQIHKNKAEQNVMSLYSIYLFLTNSIYIIEYIT